MTKLKSLALAALLFCPGAAFAGSPDHPLRIGWVQAMANAPAPIAEAKGLFRQEGLDVEMRAFGEGPAIQQAVAAGEIDVAYIGAPPVYQWAAHGLDSRIIAKVNSGQGALVVRADGPIHSLSDLRGRRLAGLNRGSGMDVLLRGYVLKEAAGLDPDRDLTLSQMPVGNMNPALDRGVVEAVFEWEPFVSQSVLRGAGRVAFDAGDALPNTPRYVVAATSRAIHERPEDLVKLLRAHNRAIAFIAEHPDESNWLIAEIFHLASVTAANGATIEPEAIVAEARKRLAWSDVIYASDRDFIQRMIGYSASLGLLDKTISVDGLIDTQFLARAVSGKS